MIIPYCTYILKELKNQEITVYDFSELLYESFSFPQPNNILIIPTENKLNDAPGFYLITNQENKINIKDLRNLCERLVSIPSGRGWLRTKKAEDQLSNFDINLLEEHYEAITTLKNPKNNKIDVLLNRTLYTLAI